MKENGRFSVKPLRKFSYVIDGNAMLQGMVAIPSTLGEFAERVMEQLPRAPRVDFFTDSYLPHYIKGIESEWANDKSSTRLENVSFKRRE